MSEVDAAAREWGKLGARRRWNGRRIVRLDALDPTVRAVVLNLVETAERIAREKAAVATQDATTASAEGHCNDRSVA